MHLPRNWESLTQFQSALERSWVTQSRESPALWSLVAREGRAPAVSPIGAASPQDKIYIS